MNIVLCGFMGAGKTSVGRQIAKITGRRFTDTDELVELKEGKKISQIFDEKGEDYFRELEHQICVEAAEMKNAVISTGGGALTFKRNADILSKTGEIILLDADLETLWERLKDDTTRPLLQRENKKQIMTDLYERRLPFYKENSTMTVDASMSPMKVCDEIIRMLRQKYA